MANNLPNITDAHFTTKRGKDAGYILAFDNGQIVYCYGYAMNQEDRQKLVDKCENYYLAHRCITHYAIHARPEHLHLN